MSQSPPPTSVTISSEAPFLSAIEHYADENKPDPLSLKQLKGLSVEWENRTLESHQHQFTFDPSHLLHGTLSISGEYMVVRLNIVCAWIYDESDPKYGNLSYKCRASAKLKPKSTSKEEGSKVEEKIRSKMQKRLKKDAYISKLLINSEEESNNNGESSSFSSWPVFASAEIMFLPTELEERVDVSQPIAEAIKRAVWSSAESNLDIIDLILHFPSLPTTLSLHKDTLVTATELANRAKLRLLEDAMVDACEQEGEDEILEDLTIDGEKKNEQDGDNNNRAEESREKSRSKRSKRSKGN